MLRFPRLLSRRGPTAPGLPPRVALLALSLSLCGAVVLGAPGCRSTPSDIAEGPSYPEERGQSRVVDIQVTRDDTHITFTNTTAQAIPPCRMWLNRWYMLDFQGLGVGETVTLDLRDFRDRYGDRFRGGGFFATEFPDKLVLAQLEIGPELVGLVVIAGDP